MTGSLHNKIVNAIGDKFSINEWVIAALNKALKDPTLLPAADPPPEEPSEPQVRPLLDGKLGRRFLEHYTTHGSEPPVVVHYKNLVEKE